jgi:hypothetical protein
MSVKTIHVGLLGVLAVNIVVSGGGGLLHSGLKVFVHLFG